MSAKKKPEVKKPEVKKPEVDCNDILLYLEKRKTELAGKKYFIEACIYELKERIETYKKDITVIDGGLTEIINAIKSEEKKN